MLAAYLVVLVPSVSCSWLDDRPAPVQPPVYSAAAQAASPVFTTAHSSFGSAARDFFSVRSTPRQPIEFPHNTHIEKGIACTESCHESVTKGPNAGLPSVNTCLICHAAIATDKPRIQQITALQEKGLDLDWQRVYGYTQAAHVKFNHAPHIRANVECSTCHGDIAHQTVAQRNVDLHMGFCVNCHREKNAPNDCLTCHF
jgi:formamidopyrimidine-DNA glycosylase